MDVSRNVDFGKISIMRSGTVLYDISAYCFIVDPKDLEKGLLSIITYAPNDEMQEALVRLYGLMHLVS